MGTFEQAKGKVKEAAGDLTDNPELEAEGRAQKKKGEAEREANQHRAKAKAHDAEAKAEGARARDRRTGQVVPGLPAFEGPGSRDPGPLSCSASTSVRFGTFTGLPCPCRPLRCRKQERCPVSQARTVDPNAVARSVAELRADDLGKGELRAALNAVVEASATVFGADGAGVMLIDDQQALHYVGATDGRPAALEAAQEETGEGPCIDSLVNDTLVFTPDLVGDDRWPLLRQQIGSLGVRAILGAPLRLGHGRHRVAERLPLRTVALGGGRHRRCAGLRPGGGGAAGHRHPGPPTAHDRRPAQPGAGAPGGDRAGRRRADGHGGHRRRARVRRPAASRPVTSGPRSATWPSRSSRPVGSIHGPTDRGKDEPGDRQVVRRHRPREPRSHRRSPRPRRHVRPRRGCSRRSSISQRSRSSTRRA